MGATARCWAIAICCGLGSDIGLFIGGICGVAGDILGAAANRGDDICPCPIPPPRGDWAGTIWGPCMGPGCAHICGAGAAWPMGGARGAWGAGARSGVRGACVGENMFGTPSGASNHITQNKLIMHAK